MKRTDLLPYITATLDDSLNVQAANTARSDARLVVWQCGFEPLVIAVQSYLPGIRLDADEAEEIATDYLREHGWFSGAPTPADFVI